MSNLLRSSTRRGRRAALGVAVVVITGGGLLWQVAAQATTPLAYNFQLDGDIGASSYGNFTPPAPAGSLDWYDAAGAHGFVAPCGGAGPACATDPETNATRPSGDVQAAVTLPNASYPGYIAVSAQPDYNLPDPTVFTTGSKDTLPISGWQCTQKNNIGAKDDLLNTYQVAFRDPTTNDLVIDFGAEKSSDLGDNNIAIWLLQDGTVNCDSTGGTTTFTGSHTNGDILLAAAFTNGGGTASIDVYKWQSGALVQVGTESHFECQASPNNTLPPPNAPIAACAITNDGTIPVPWNAPAKTTPGAGQLASEEFYEGAMDVTQLLGGVTPCFNTTITDTRSSQSPTATIFDFTRQSLPTCGTIKVHKYIDPGMDGRVDSSDINSGAPVTGWQFAVTDSGGHTVCTGTTDATGGISCPDLQPGTYTVTETQQSGFFNTDPGTVSGSTLVNRLNAGSTVSETVNLGFATKDVYFGNDCFVKKTFEIDDVPTGAASPITMTAAYNVSSGDVHGSSSGTVALTRDDAQATAEGAPAGSVWDGSLTNTLAADDVLSWNWYINGDPSHSEAGATNESLAGDDYPACSVRNQVPFLYTTLVGIKKKDLNGTGANVPINGFQFQLINSAGTVVATTTSQTTNGNAGIITFASVPPGAYTVHEVPVTGWVQTAPAGDATVVVHLGDTLDPIAEFDNTPLSSIGVTFTPNATLPGTSTPATQGNISCTSGGSQTGNSYSSTQVKIGTYTCTVVITDP